MIGATEEDRDELMRAIAEAYAHGECTEVEMETLTEHAAAARSSEELEAVVRELPVSASPRFLAPSSVSGPVQTISARSGSVRREGKWVQSPVIQVSGASSSFRLDFRAYNDLRGAAIRLDLDTASSSVRITLPACFDVKDAISENVSSVVRVRLRPGKEPTSNVLILTGKVKSSEVRIKRKR